MQAATVGEPTRWGWEAALKAVIYFLRPEGLLPHGIELAYHEAHEDHEESRNLISLCVLRALRGDIFFDREPDRG